MLPTGGAPAENGFWLIVRLKKSITNVVTKTSIFDTFVTHKNCLNLKSYALEANEKAGPDPL